MTDAEFLKLWNETKAEILTAYRTLTPAQKRGIGVRKGSKIAQASKDRTFLVMGNKISMARLGLNEETTRQICRDYPSLIALHMDRHRHLEAIALR